MACLARSELVRLKDAMFMHLCAELFDKMTVMAEDFGMTCLASPLHHSTEQRIPAFEPRTPLPFKQALVLPKGDLVSQSASSAQSYALSGSLRCCCRGSIGL